MRKIKMAGLFMAVAALCLTGCQMSINAGGFNISDISYADSEKYISGAAELSQTVEYIEINWPVGSVTVKPHDSDTVSFSEESDKELSDDTQLRYWLDGATLHIQFCRAGKWRLDDMKKDLTVLVPENLALADLEVNSISAILCLDGLQAERLTIGTTSGDMRLVGCAATELKVKSISATLSLDGLQAEGLTIGTTSGDMRLVGCAVTKLASVSTISGELEAEFAQPLEEFSSESTSGTFRISAPAIERFSFSSISGPVLLNLEEAPKTLDIQTTSGNIDLVLPEDASFTLDYDATSGELSSDLPYTMEGGRYIFGEGKDKYVIDTISGDVRITAEE